MEDGGPIHIFTAAAAAWTGKGMNMARMAYSHGQESASWFEKGQAQSSCACRGIFLPNNRKRSHLGIVLTLLLTFGRLQIICSLGPVLGCPGTMMDLPMSLQVGFCKVGS